MRFPSSCPDNSLTQILVEIDIRRPDTGNVSISRPTPTTSHTNTDSTTTPEIHSPLALGHHYTEPVSEGEEDETMAIALPMSENDAARVPLAAALEAIAWREQQRQKPEVAVEKRRAEGRRNGNEGPAEVREEAHEGTPFLRRGPPKARENSKGTRTLSINPLAPSVEFDRHFKKKLGHRGRGSRSISRDPSAERREAEDEAAFAEASTRNQGGDTVYTTAFSAQAGKRIAVPVRVEPKVFFAQERTFLVCFSQHRINPVTDVELIRNGSISESCLEPSLPPCSTSPIQAIALTLSLQGCSLWFPFSLLLMLPGFSSTAHSNSGSMTQMPCTMTHTGQPSYPLQLWPL